ncbi:MAG: PAS domain S-box protein [Kiritimatiellales bacterium]|nr:PAS domain S-box protein [Kiritimatiellales bacterium]
MKWSETAFYRATACLKYAALAVIAAIPTAGCAEDGGSGGVFEHLETDFIIIMILLSNTVLLFGFLIWLRQSRQTSSRQSKEIDTRNRHIHLLGDNLPNVTVFQFTRNSNGEFSFNYLSQGYEHILGIARDRVIQDARIAFDNIYEEDLPHLQAAYNQSTENLSVVDVEIRVLDVSGTLKWIRISAVPHQEKGAMVWDGFMQDVSAGKMMEGVLAEENLNFQNLFETINDFLLVCDMDGSLLHTNPSVGRRLKYSGEELASMALLDLYPRLLRDEVKQTLLLLADNETVLSNLPLQTNNGEQIPVDMNIFQGNWKNKRALFCVARDMTNSKKIEDALRESQRMLQLIMNTIPICVFWKDRDSVYLGCNQAFTKMCGLPSIEDVVGKTPFDVFDQESAAEIIEQDQQVITANEPLYNYLHAYTRTDGGTGWRESSKIPLHDEEGVVVGVLGIWRDVTDQKQAEERLKRTLEDMERFNQLMRGRERRTLELKAEVNELLKQQAQPIKYRTSSDTII